MNKEFWVWNTGEFVKVKDIEEYDEEFEFNVISKNSLLQVLPKNADKLYFGILEAKRKGSREGLEDPEPVEEWQNLSPLKVILAIKNEKTNEEIISIYPIPEDIRYNL